MRVTAAARVSQKAQVADGIRRERRRRARLELIRTLSEHARPNRDLVRARRRAERRIDAKERRATTRDTHPQARVGFAERSPLRRGHRKRLADVGDPFAVPSLEIAIDRMDRRVHITVFQCLP